MEPNPVMIQVFGPVPEGLNLTETTATADMAAVLVLLGLAVIAVFFRFVARVVQRSGFKMDDWTIILALVRCQSPEKECQDSC